MSYHEHHEVALPTRARSEEKTIVDLLTRELDERLMAHLPRAGHVETDIAHDRHTELLVHRERFVRHVKSVASKRTTLAGQLEAELWQADTALKQHLEKVGRFCRELSNEKNNHSPTLKRLQREAVAAHNAFSSASLARFERLNGSANAMLQSILKVNSDFRNSWLEFVKGGNFNEDELHAEELHNGPKPQEGFTRRLGLVDEDAAAETQRQQEHLVGLQAEQVKRMQSAMSEMEVAMAVNMEDVQLLEGLKLRQGAATAEVRILLSKCAMQESAIGEQVTRLQRLLPSAGAKASASGEQAEGSDAPLPMRVMQASVAPAPHLCPPDRNVATHPHQSPHAHGRSSPDPSSRKQALDSLCKLLLERAHFLAVLQSTGIPFGQIPLSLEPPSEEAAVAEDPSPEIEPMMDGVRAVRQRHEAEMIAYCVAYYEAKVRDPARVQMQI